MNLGTLTAGEFFGEMALLPLESEWRHQRTTTAAGNVMLYYLTRQKLENVATRECGIFMLLISTEQAPAAAFLTKRKI